MPDLNVQSARIEDYARKILGEHIFEKMVAFFLALFYKAFQKELKNEKLFIVFITRRCHVLMEVFMRIFLDIDVDTNMPAWYRLRKLCAPLDEIEMSLEKGYEIYRSVFLTDMAALALCKEFVAMYISDGCFPNLIICDELLIHGRAMNGFLRGMEDRLIEFYLQAHCTDDKEKASERIRNSFLKTLELNVYAQNDDVTLLLPRYCRVLNVYHSGMPKCEWRALSMFISRLIAVSNVNNSAFSLTFSNAIEGPYQFDSKVSDDVTKFIKLRTEIYDYVQNTWVYLFPEGMDTKAICTVREKVSRSTYKGKKYQMFVPFIMYDHLEYNNVLSLRERIKQDLEADMVFCPDKKKRVLAFMESNLDNEELDKQRLSAINELFLSALLMKEFLKETKNREDILLSLDEYQLARNFARIDENGKLTQEEVCNAIKYILEWDPPMGSLERYIGLLTEKGCSSVWDGSVFGTGGYVPADKAMDSKFFAIDAVLDVSAEIGLKAERNAYEHRNSGIRFSEKDLSNWGDRITVREFLRKCQNKLKSKYYAGQGTISLYAVAAIITQAMDLGLIGMNIGMNPHDLDEEIAYTAIKAGEQTLCIHPVRYAMINETLERIVDKYQKEEGGIEIETMFFVDRIKSHGLYRDDGNLLERVLEYVKELKETGQLLAEWRIVSEKSSLDVQLSIDKYCEALVERMIINGQMMRSRSNR